MEEIINDIAELINKKDNTFLFISRGECNTNKIYSIGKTKEIKSMLRDVMIDDQIREIIFESLFTYLKENATAAECIDLYYKMCNCDNSFR